MTSVEIVTTILQLMDGNKFNRQDIEKLEKKLQKIDRLDGFLFEYKILPKLGSTLFEIQM